MAIDGDYTWGRQRGYNDALAAVAEELRSYTDLLDDSNPGVHGLLTAIALVNDLIKRARTNAM